MDAKSVSNSLPTIRPQICLLLPGLFDKAELKQFVQLLAQSFLMIASSAGLGGRRLLSVSILDSM